jgi:hypothetical protein
VDNDPAAFVDGVSRRLSGFLLGLVMGDIPAVALTSDGTSVFPLHDVLILTAVHLLAGCGSSLPPSNPAW